MYGSVHSFLLNYVSVKVFLMNCLWLNTPVLAFLIRQPFESVYLCLYNHGSNCLNSGAIKGKISWLAHLLCKFGSVSLTTVWLHNRKCAIHISFCRENSERAEISHQSNCTQSTMQQKLYSDTFPFPCPEDNKLAPFCFVFLLHCIIDRRRGRVAGQWMSYADVETVVFSEMCVNARQVYHISGLVASDQPRHLSLLRSRH